MTTFRQVQKQFSAVFSELVDGGEGKLVLQRDPSIAGNDNLNSSSEEDSMLLEEYDDSEESDEHSSSSSSEESSSEGEDGSDEDDNDSLHNRYDVETESHDYDDNDDF